jgi:two-component system, NtrC family, response regulator AtoC
MQAECQRAPFVRDSISFPAKHMQPGPVARGRMGNFLPIASRSRGKPVPAYFCLECAREGEILSGADRRSCMNTRASTPFKILVVDDEKEMCISLSRIFTAKGYDAHYETDPSGVPDRLAEREYDLLLVDIKMPRLGGIELLRRIKARRPRLPIIMITGYASFDNAVLAMKFGANNVYPKPIDTDTLLREVETLAGAASGGASGSPSPAAPDAAPELTFQSEAMRQVMASADRAAGTDVPVLITGETGTGKELIADYLHQRSARAAKEITKLNCAAIPDALLESELFGYEKGAFTGAVTAVRGKFEVSDKGSLFLDEIGDMSLSSQSKMLRVLQEGSFNRLGAARPIHADVRVISATNRDIADLITQGTFREDLYYRLSVITIEMPPLRRRREDIAPLAQYFVSLFNRKHGRTIQSISPPVMEVFFSHDWPGNVRELRNCVERAVIYSDGPSILREHLPGQYVHSYAHGSYASLEEKASEMTKTVILEALFKTDGSRQKAAELLKINRKTLYNNMKKLGLK